jgi:GNAT superfamily N-acetyltransferase
MLGSALLPGAAAQGYTPTMQDAAQFSLDTMLGGGLLGRAPSGSLAVNVFHGTPHKFAPEPGFPYGRPRLDKMGTGEGAQAYGPGFYSAESKGVATDYRNVLSPPPSVRVGGDAMTSSQFANTLSGKAASKYPDMPVEEIERQSGNAARMIFNRAEELKNIDGNDNVLMRAFLDSQSKRDDSLSKILRVARDEMPVAKWSEETGTLYKLDIPDADAAKTLDWDAPLEKQPKPIRDAYSKAMLGDEVFKDPILKELFADGVPNQHLGLLENSSGAQAFNTLAGKLGSQQAAADALREAGIPGVKYLDQGSRGAGEGSRNYAIWDQDVLDRTKMLERDGVTLGANKSPTAATAGLLSRSPLEERATGAIVETSKRGDVLEISKIETPKGSRGQGLAQSKLDEIIAQADKDGMTLALTPSNAFGASKKRLTDWYRRNGFVPNKGQNKNFATRESMVRPPAVPLGNRGLLD